MADALATDVTSGEATGFVSDIFDAFDMLGVSDASAASTIADTAATGAAMIASGAIEIAPA